MLVFEMMQLMWYGFGSQTCMMRVVSQVGLVFQMMRYGLCRGHTTLTPIRALACVCPSRRTEIQQTLTHYKASTMSTNIQNSFTFSCMHKKPLILVKWIQITYIIAFNSHNWLQYNNVFCRY